MTDADESTTPGPYARAAASYWSAGWQGALPLPARKKADPPSGWTGHKNPEMPSWADVTAWIETNGDGNIGIRLPRHVVGIDVDNYGAKTGAANLADMIAKYGPLPATWTSSSRMETGSGISLYRVAEGLQWPGKVTDAIEVIQFGHRYMVAWPSMHPEGRVYRWHEPSGAVALDAIPTVDDLPWLPQAWVDGLTAGQLHEDMPLAGLLGGDIGVWLVAHERGGPCDRMTKAIASRSADLRAPGASRHDTATNAVMYIVRLMGEGHHGGLTAIGALKGVFDEVAGADPNRTRDTAEWGRLLHGAVDRVAAMPVVEVDPCADYRPGLKVTGPPLDQAGPASQPGASPAAETGDRSTWWPRPIGDLLAGTDPEPPPRYLTRIDGAPLLYAGKVNGIIGESESGKSFIALLAVAQALAAGEGVTYIDFEDTGSGTISRLRLLGIADDVIAAQFRYIGPQEGLELVQKRDLAEHVEAHRPTLIVLDGFNAAMTLMNLDLNSNTDATKFSQELLGPLTRLGVGACIVYIDHLPKNNRENETKGGIGAQAKRAMTTGCTLKAEVVVQFGRGTSGKVKLSVDKDRPGHVRGALTGALAGMFIVTAAADGSLALAIEAPPAGPWRPTAIMQEISIYLADRPKGASQTAIEKAIEHKTEHVRLAIKLLLKDGFIRQESGARNAIISIHVNSFIDGLHMADPVPPSHPGPTPSGRDGESPSSTPSRPTPYMGGTGSEAVTGDRDDDGEDNSPRPGLDREQTAERQAAYRVSLESGGRPRYQDDLSVIDTNSGEVVWQP